VQIRNNILPRNKTFQSSETRAEVRNKNKVTVTKIFQANFLFYFNFNFIFLKSGAHDVTFTSASMSEPDLSAIEYDANSNIRKRKKNERPRRVWK